MKVAPVLDACCGGRSMWYDKQDPRSLFIDIRSVPPGTIQQRPNFQVKPDLIADFRTLPFDDETFKLIAWDPPHLRNLSSDGWVAKKYGSLDSTWSQVLKEGFKELWRVLAQDGVLVFKWSSPTKDKRSIPIQEVLSLFPQQPLFGSRPSGKTKTYWLIFFKCQKEALLANNGASGKEKG